MKSDPSDEEEEAEEEDKSLLYCLKDRRSILAMVKRFLGNLNGDAEQERISRSLAVSCIK